MTTCKALNKLGERCGTRFGLTKDGFCRHHSSDNVCRGKCKDGTKCMAPRKPQYDYCSAAHDPSLYYVCPGLFGREILRSEKIGVVAEYCQGRDIFHDKKLDIMNLHQYQVSHILDKQCFAFATMAAGITRRSDQEWVASFVQDEIVNRSRNLCITRKPTNVMKGRACFKFLDDYVTGHRDRGDGATLDTYLKKEILDGERLQRSTTLRIRKNMGARIKFSQRKLAAEGDSPEFERMAVEMQKLYFDMDLRVRSMA